MNKSNTSNSGERLIRIIEEHWVKFVVPVFIYLALSGGGIVCMMLGGSFSGVESMLGYVFLFIGVALLFIAHHWFFAFLLGEAIDCIVITNQRSIFFETKLLIHDDMVENSFDKMRSVEAYQEGFLQNVLLYGSLRFQGGRDIHLVPHPHRVAKEIQQAMGRI